MLKRPNKKSIFLTQYLKEDVPLITENSWRKGWTNRPLPFKQHKQKQLLPHPTIPLPNSSCSF